MRIREEQKPLHRRPPNPSPSTRRHHLAVLSVWALAPPLAFVGAGAWKVELGASLVDGIYKVVEIGVGGTVIGLLYGTDEPAAAPAAAPSPPPAAPEAPAAEE